MVTIGPAAIQRIAQGIDHAAQNGVADRDGEQAAGAADFVPLVNLEVIAEDDHAHRVFFEVEGQAEDIVGEFDHLAGHDAGEAIDAGHTVAHLDDPPDFADVDFRLVLLNFVLD